LLSIGAVATRLTVHRDLEDVSWSRLRVMGVVGLL